jgi:hypothetical protein
MESHKSSLDVPLANLSMSVYKKCQLSMQIAGRFVTYLEISLRRSQRGSSLFDSTGSVRSQGSTVPPILLSQIEQGCNGLLIVRVLLALQHHFLEFVG